MNKEMILTNARLVLRDGVSNGTVRMARGYMDEVSTTRSLVADAQDLGGDYLIPGLVELHTDHLETHLVPRPGVVWPQELAALMAHDAQLVGAGITTVFDSLCVGVTVDDSERRILLDKSIRAIATGREKDILRADHRLHLRCEVSEPELVEMFDAHVDNPLVGLVSVMDHTPGQRQWTDLDKFRQYHRKRQWTDEEFQAVVEKRKVCHAMHAEPNRRAVLDRCRERNLTVASHDDTLPEHVDEAVAEGIGISEFPTTLEAARRARDAGMKVIMGAPNVVRGESHSGNVSAVELARAGLLDILSSDYLPQSMLSGAFVLHLKEGLPLHETVAMITVNPAEAVSLPERGEIAPGKVADLVQVRMVDDLPVVMGVWRNGRRVF